MDADEVAKLLLAKHSLRVRRAMSEYVLRHLNNRASDESIAVIGCDARTGVPLRMLVPLHTLTSVAAAPPASSAIRAPS